MEIRGFTIAEWCRMLPAMLGGAYLFFHGAPMWVFILVGLWGCWTPVINSANRAREKREKIEREIAAKRVSGIEERLREVTECGRVEKDGAPKD